MKQHHILLKTACLCSMVLATVSCDNYDDLYPQKYEKILMLKETGEKSLTVYTSDETATFPISVMKTGSNTTLSAQVTLRPMTATELAEYSAEYGTSYYTAVPTSCYSFSETGEGNTADGINISYESADKYKLLNVYMNPKELYSFEETLTGIQQAIIPLVLVSESDSISSASNKLFIRPQVVVPTIYFEVSGFNRYGLSTVNSAGNVEVNIPISMPIENRWTFNCTAEVNEQLLTDYNAANGTDYQLLPADMYTPLASTYQFTKGNSSTNIKIEIDKSKLDFSTEYVLPIKLLSSELDGVDIDAEAGYCLAHISCKVALTEDMLSTNSLSQCNNGYWYDGVGLVGLIDGGGTAAGGLFHTGYVGDGWVGAYGDGYNDNQYNKVDATYGKYVDFHLPFAITTCQFDFMSRTTNANGVPQLVELYTSKDGKIWTKLTSITDMHTKLTAGGKWATFGAYTATEEFTYLRFAAITSHGGGDMRTDVTESWNCQEFVLYAK